MNRLGRKQSSSNSEWLEAARTIEDIVSRTSLDELVERTVAGIAKTTDGKKTAYAWSGGKDSIVLGKLCEAAGVKDSMIGVCNLEYPAFMDWINENKPEGCEVINTKQDIGWLKNHPTMLFPKESALVARWFSIVQHTAQNHYFKTHELDMLLLGRRRAEGNFVGRGVNLYTNGKGVQRYSPMADWKHEDVLAYLHYHEFPIPPIYGWKDGYVFGTHPWPARPSWTKPDATVAEKWREIYDIDPSIVALAAEHFESARLFLGGDA